ncbi:MAG: trehalose-phosphatase [Proteobacteria bacterium]|nr:trehalose-phosphatase [Pseudomonadota bacterium]
MDYDGTLAPFHVDPSKAFPYPGVRNLLNRIMDAPGVHVVIISGRWTKDLIPLLHLQKQPEIWGSHGLERLKMDGIYEIASMDERALNGLVTADDWVESKGLSSRCEKKPGCLALHWRGLRDQEISEIKNRVIPEWRLIAEGWTLRLLEFDGGLELRVPGRNKGDAIKTILEEMEQDVVAAYLGDDLTDEDAFRSIKGRGIGVLVRKVFRPTDADLWIKPPEELLEFLSVWARGIHRDEVQHSRRVSGSRILPP